MVDAWEWCLLVAVDVGTSSEDVGTECVDLTVVVRRLGKLSCEEVELDKVVELEIG